MCAAPKREGVMLCYPAEPKRVARLGEIFMVQPKLNGERCRVEWFANEPVLVSSYGNVFKGLEHIENAIKDFCYANGEQWCLDGELYVHGWTRELIHSVVSRKENIHPRAGEMEFHVFDIQQYGVPQVKRTADLNQAYVQHLFDTKDKSPLYVVNTYRCDQNEWIEYCATFCAEGYEGVILRNPWAYYETKRTVNCLKFKPTEHDDYEIVNVIEAISKDGDPKGMVGAFLVRGDNNQEFEVGAGKLKHRERIELWEKRQSLTGLLLHVKHELITTNSGIPIAAVAVNVKGYKHG